MSGHEHHGHEHHDLDTHEHDHHEHDHHEHHHDEGMDHAAHDHSAHDPLKFRKLFWISLALTVPTEAEARTLYDALADGGTADMPLTPAHVWRAMQGRALRTDLAIG